MEAVSCAKHQKRDEKSSGICSPYMDTMSSLFYLSACIRLLSIVVVQSFFVPDEYWQSLEVAHNSVFHYGSLTWEWKEQIRGFAYPGLFAALYKSLTVLHFDDSIWLLINGPRVLQSVFTAWCDVRTYTLTRDVFDSRTAMYAYGLQLTSWFVFYTGSRTLTNTMEMCLSIIGLSYLPLSSLAVQHEKIEKTHRVNSLCLSFFFGASACVIRPTAALTWLPVFVWAISHTKIKHLFAPLLIGSAVVLTSTMIDCCYYGQFVFVPWQFFQFNVLNNLAIFYGVHPWHWYFTQGLPAIAMPQLMLLGVAAAKIQKHNWMLLSIIVLNLTVYSLQSHKEFRFILPLLPLIHCYCGYGLGYFTNDFKTSKLDDKVHLSSRWCALLEPINALTMVGKSMFLLGVFLNAVVAVILGMFFQCGTGQLMDFIRTEASRSPPGAEFLFLMPCHSTPFYSHVHHPVILRQLECPPSADPTYIDEAATFYLNPLKWLQHHQATTKHPHYVIMYNSLQPTVSPWLLDNGYKQCADFYHRPFSDGRVGTRILVFCRHSDK